MGSYSNRSVYLEGNELKYDFSKLYQSIAGLYEPDTYIRKKNLESMKQELNLFFKDFYCSQIRISENIDCDFFGAYIVPYFSDPNVLTKFLNPDYDDSGNIKFHHYTLDLDSRLFDKVNGFTPEAIAALIIHDVNELNNSDILNKFMCAADCISTKCCSPLNTTMMMSDYWLYMFVMMETIRNMTSCFEFCTTDLIIANDFIIDYGIRDAYDDGMEAVKFAKNKLNDQIKCPTLLLNWYLSVYKRGSAIDKTIAIGDVIEDSMRFSGSKNLRDVMKNIVTYNKLPEDDDKNAYLTALTEASSTKKKQSLISQIKKNGMRSIEDDLYEYRIRIKNLETENDAVGLIRELNNRVGIISDYLDNEDLTESEKERMYKLYDKYCELREELAKKSTYNKKMYGLFVDYNALRQMSDSNYSTMNTYY